MKYQESQRRKGESPNKKVVGQLDSSLPLKERDGAHRTEIAGEVLQSAKDGVGLNTTKENEKRKERGTQEKEVGLLNKTEQPVFGQQKPNDKLGLGENIFSLVLNTNGAQSDGLGTEYMGLFEILENLDKDLTSDTMAKLLRDEGDRKKKDSNPRRRQVSHLAKVFREMKKPLMAASSSSRPQAENTLEPKDL